jgi:hypothetical protein
MTLNDVKLCSTCVCRLKKVAPGAVLYVPKKDRRITRPEVRRLYSSGWRVVHIARELGITPRRVYQLLQKGRA